MAGEIMSDEYDDYLMFDKLNLNNCDVSMRDDIFRYYRGNCSYIFNENITTIVGKMGAGKTTLLNTLHSLGLEQHAFDCDDIDGAQLITHGNRELITKYSDIMFIQCENMTIKLDDVYRKAIKRCDPVKLDSVILNIFNNLVENQPHKIKIAGGLNPLKMVNTTEMICFRYAVVFATRKLLKLNLPLVLDDPYSYLDSEIAESLKEFLLTQDCQKIFLLRERRRKKPDYILLG